MKRLQGKKAFIAGVSDDRGFGWAIAKELAEHGCEILLGTWVPTLKIFQLALRNKKLNTTLSDGSEMKIASVYPIDASYDSMEDVPSSVLENKRYKSITNFTIGDVTSLIEEDHGKIDFFIHSLANAPEVKNSLLETSRKGYLEALSSSSYSFISFAKHLSPIMNQNGSMINLSYIAAANIVPGYGGGMSSAKAALESDTRTLAYEVGRKYKLRVNSISAGPLESRAAKAIGFIDKMVQYSEKHSPLQRKLLSKDVAKAASFLLSDEASGITASTIYVDNGLHAMGPSLEKEQLAVSI